MTSILLDNPNLLGRLFFPSDQTSPTPANAQDFFVEVSGARLHLRVHGRNPALTLLLFHGNGENVCDWDDSALRFARHGVGLAVMDYRGYGASTGTPTMGHLFRDAHATLAFLRAKVAGPIAVMGRSLGSAAAWEVAQDLADTIDLAAVIIDSGFVDVDALTRRRGIDPATLPDAERAVLDALPKIARSHQPLLLLHGEEDRAIAIREAEQALAASPSADKRLTRLPGRGHNDLWAHPDYWASLGQMLTKLVSH